MNLWYSFHFFLQSCHSLDLFFFFIIVAGFFRCLIHWFCRCNPFTVTTIFCFFLLVSSGDDGIFLLFLGEVLFHPKLNSLWLFVIFTHLSVCCLIGFVLHFLEFHVTGSIESNVSSLSLLRWYLLFSTVLVTSVQIVFLNLADVPYFL